MLSYFQGNKFTGTIPREVCERNFNENWFMGHESGIGRDGCTSVACPTNTEAFHQGVYPCSECKDSFMNPYLGSNECISLNPVRCLLLLSSFSKLKLTFLFRCRNKF